MNKIVKTLFIIIVLLIFLVAFSPSYNSLNIDNLAYVVGLGIDFGENEKYKISFQFSPKKTADDKGSSSSSSESDSKQNSSSIINTVEAPSIDTAINIMNSYLAKKINLSHCKIVVFSEEVAYSGISEEIYTLTTNSEIRPSASIVISKNTAYDYLDSSSPILEDMITKYYEVFPYSSKYTGYICEATLGDFYNNLVSVDSEPYAILGGIKDKESNYSNSMENSKASENTINGNRDSENIGLAVFNEGQLVGELGAIDTLCFSITQNKINSFLIRISDPQNESQKIDIIVFPKKINIIVKIINGAPYIEYNGKFEARIHSIDKDSKYLDSKVLNEISESVNKYLTSILTDYFYKTSIEFKSDINGFGKHALSNFLTINEFEKFCWKNSYQDSIFKVKIESIIDSGILITET